MELIPSYNETYPIMELILLSRWERLNYWNPGHGVTMTKKEEDVEQIVRARQ